VRPSSAPLAQVAGNRLGRLLRAREIWFPTPGAEVVVRRPWQLLRLFHAPRRVDGVVGRWNRRQTLVTDLGALDTLPERLSSSLRYQIRRSRERDGLRIVDDWTPEQAVAFADAKDAPNPNRPNLERLRALAAIDRLVIRAAYLDDEPVCVHMILVTDRIARGLYTHTARHAVDRQRAAAVGRATKALDLENLYHLRDRGLAEFDWGGYTGVPGNGVDAYKAEFRGALRQSWVFDGVALSRSRPLRF
jgi:hypothetical protein